MAYRPLNGLGFLASLCPLSRYCFETLNDRVRSGDRVKSHRVRSGHGSKILTWFHLWFTDKPTSSSKLNFVEKVQKVLSKHY